MTTEDASLDILSSSLDLLGAATLPESPTVSYGALTVSRPPRAGKANTLLADQVFNLGLVTAERIEAGTVDVSGQCVLELGCGAGIPSLVAASLAPPRTPKLVVLTDYPDPDLLHVLNENVERNRPLGRGDVVVRGYEWGQPVQDLLSLLLADKAGYDTLILADLLHLTPPITPLLSSLVSLLDHISVARAYVSVGAYTKQPVVDNFLAAAEQRGFAWQAWDLGARWEGSNVQGVGDVSSNDDLGVVKTSVRGWVLRWRIQ